MATVKHLSNPTAEARIRRLNKMINQLIEMEGSFTDHEVELRRQAYIALSNLHNSQHRLLVEVVG